MMTFPSLRRVQTLALSVFAATTVACLPAGDGTEPTPTPDPDPTEQSILATAEADGRFTTLLDAIDSAELTDTLNGDGPFTVFAPTDDAFDAMDPDVLAAALADPDGLLTQVLTYHVVNGEVPAADVVDLTSATTLEGSDISIEVVDGAVILDGKAEVILTDIDCTNGLIHVIDAVLLPAEDEPAVEDIVDTAINDGRFTTLVDALTAANLVDTLRGDGPFTVFAPTDDAFAAMDQDVLAAALADPSGLLTQVLTYHVVNGEVPASDVVNLTTATTLEGSNITIEVVDGAVILNGEAEVVITDIECTNGLIHVIDAVLLPADEPELQDIVDTAIDDGRFTTLVTALTNANLVDTLRGDGPFTVFAPTDDAFAAMDQDVLNAALADPNGLLTEVLTYHVVSGSVPAADVVNLTSATTLEGRDISIEVVDGNVILNGNAQVIITDIETANGIIHVVDTVLLPPQRDIVDTAINDGRFTTLVTALTNANLVDTLRGDGPFTVFAPTDDAFAAMDQDVLNAALADPNGLLTEVLLYHVVSGNVPAADVVNLSSAITIDGRLVTIEVVDGNVILNGNAQVIITDIETANGTIHVLDTVLLPPSDTIVDVVVNDDRFDTLETAVIAAGLVDTLNGPGPFTVFAPTDDAFAAMDQATLNAALADPQGLLTEVLTYHVVDGTVPADAVVGLSTATTLDGRIATIEVVDGNVILNGNAQVIITDIAVANGVIHVIDTVLLPPTDSIVDVVVNDDRFDTLETAVIAAGLVDTLNGDGPFTVFAPTDDAFAAMDQATLNAALADPQGLLTDVLTYHVVGGAAVPSDVVTGMSSATTLQGGDVMISINAGSVFLNTDVEVIVTDIPCRNGIIHVIDGVLLPPAAP